MDPGSVPRVGDYGERGATFEYTDPRHAAWAGVADVWLQGTFENGFADDYLPVESIDPVTKRMNMGIYCDDSPTGVLVHGNVFCRMMTKHGVLFSNSGWDLTATQSQIATPGGDNETVAVTLTGAPLSAPKFFIRVAAE